MPKAKKAAKAKKKKVKSKKSKRSSSRRRPSPLLLTRRELADRLAVHMQTVSKWEQAGMPIEQRGSRGIPTLYNLAAVKAWLQVREEDRRSAEREAPPNFAIERAKKTRWEAALRQQEYRVRAGELLQVADVEETWAKEIQAVRSLLLAVPQTHADRIHRAAVVDGTAGVERELREAIHDALSQLAGGDRSLHCPDCGRDMYTRD